MNAPGLWKLSPAIVTKPWGLVHEGARDFTGIRVGVGEFWLASAQTGPGNYSNTVSDPSLRKTLAELLDEAAEEGDAALTGVLGETAVAHLREQPHRGKTEAWYVRAAEGRTGVAAGPRNAEDAEALQELITQEGLTPNIEEWSDEARRLMGLIEPLEGGEVFVVPAGTLHTMFAIGPDSKLVIDELQQGYGEAMLPTLSKILMVQDSLLSVQVHPDDETVSDVAEGRMQVSQDLQDNPTVRVYDFGRRPGEYPELGFRLVDPDTGLRLAEPVSVEVADGHTYEVIMAHAQWLKARAHFAAGGTYDLVPQFGSYRVLHVLEGEAELLTEGRAMQVSRGETVFVPACREPELRIEAVTDCSFFDDCFPRVTVLTKFLGTRNVDAGRMEALLSPPRALPGEGS
jgi:mannose-6-phosphate isomerase class I